MKLMPSATASSTSRADCSSVFPVLRPSREKPPVPRPATLTRRLVRPRVVYSIVGLGYLIHEQHKNIVFRLVHTRSTYRSIGFDVQTSLALRIDSRSESMARA